jgi:ectoine hydroxylase-related dioxygenase (phytanoyl-CoA dioxygenase family)
MIATTRELPGRDARSTNFDLDAAYTVTPEHVALFRKQGFIKLKNVLSPETLEYYGNEITKQVIRLNRQIKPMAERNTYEKAFLQIGNIWLQSEIAREFVLSRKLARIATDLMGVRGVRLYHDQALYKEPSGGLTPWHADQFYWPLSNHNTCTVWVPFQHTPIEMGPLSFAVSSHTFEFGRTFAISDESEALIQKELAAQNFQYEESPFDLGEVSYHYGWTFHRAGPNTSAQSRSVMTVIYMDEDIRVAEPVNESQRNDWAGCLPGTKIGDLAATHLNPLLYH